MNFKIRLEEVKNRFHFGYLDYDLETEKDANLKLIQLLALAPPAATGVGLVEVAQQGFLTTVTVRSPFRSFTGKAIGPTARTSINRALERLENELYRWRFGGGSGNYGTLPKVQKRQISWARSG